MKIKLVAAKYFDVVMLTALGLLLAFSLVRNLVIKDQTLSDLTGEITRYDKTVKNALSGDEVTVEPPTDFLGDLRNRFEHLSVINPYQRDPFVLPVDIDLGLAQVRKGDTKKFTIEGARITDVTPPSSPLVQITCNYNAEEGSTAIEIVGLDDGNVLLKFRADTEQVYRLQFNIITTPEAPPPFPPRDVTILSRGPLSSDKAQNPRPMALIVFYPDNPPLDDMWRGQTTGAWIERKPAEAEDVEYVRLNKTPLLPVPGRVEAAELLRRYQPEQSNTTSGSGVQDGNPAEGPRPVYGPDGAVVPVEAPDVAGRGVTGQDAVGPTLPLIEAGVAFAFLDDSVDEGESYIYRIVTINEVENLETSLCKTPYVSPIPINVPSRVEFNVLSKGYDGSAKIRVTVPATAGGARESYDFQVPVGGVIGTKVQQKRIAAVAPAAVPGGGVALETAGMVKDIDFRTGCILVAVLPDYKKIGYRLRLSGTTMLYPVQLSPGVQILYLTPSGILRWKGKEEETASSPKAPGVVPGLPGRRYVPMRPGMEAGATTRGRI